MFRSSLKCTSCRAVNAVNASRQWPRQRHKHLNSDKHPFFSQHHISEQEWVQVYHRDGNTYSIAIGDLKTNITSQKQIKLALLVGVKNLLESGDASIPRETLVSLCKNYSAYDSPNFSSHMKKNKSYFLVKGKNDWVLTVPGQQKAGEIIKELTS